jgi:hypothetical protein
MLRPGSVSYKYGALQTFLLLGRVNKKQVYICLSSSGSFKKRFLNFQCEYI